MTELEIIDKVYENWVEQATAQLFSVLILEDNNGTVAHESAERRFRYALKMAAGTRDRAKGLIQGTER
jgi:hypothetical protein